MVATGMSKAEIGDATQIKTLSLVDLYADVSRHIRRLDVCRSALLFVWSEHILLHCRTDLTVLCG